MITMTSCQWAKDRLKLNYEPGISPLLYHKTIKSQDLLPLLRSGKIYGFVTVDISATPDAEKFRKLNWPPIFQKEEIFYEDLPTWMQKISSKEEFPKSTIVQKMGAQNILLHTHLVEFYLKNGFEITKIHKFYEYEGETCFERVFKNVYEARVQATETKNEMKATAVKLVSNSMYGQLLLVKLILFLVKL